MIIICYFFEVRLTLLHKLLDTNLPDELKYKCLMIFMIVANRGETIMSNIVQCLYYYKTTLKTVLLILLM